jgi:hypothetical protein
MKHKLWITLFTCLAYCIDRELWKAIEYLKEQVKVLKEQQEKDKRILLNNHQRIRVAAKAKELTRRLLEQTSVLFTPDTFLEYYPHERIHQALGRIIEPRHGGKTGDVICIEHLGGLLKSYPRAAA